MQAVVVAIDRACLNRVNC